MAQGARGGVGPGLVYRDAAAECGGRVGGQAAAAGQTSSAEAAATSERDVARAAQRAAALDVGVGHIQSPIGRQRAPRETQGAIQRGGRARIIQCQRSTGYRDRAIERCPTRDRQRAAGNHQRFVRIQLPGYLPGRIDGDRRVGGCAVDKHEIAGHRRHAADPVGPDVPESVGIDRPNFNAGVVERGVAALQEKCTANTSGSVVFQTWRSRHGRERTRNRAACIDDEEVVAQHRGKAVQVLHAHQRAGIDVEVAAYVDAVVPRVLAAAIAADLDFGHAAAAKREAAGNREQAGRGAGLDGAVVGYRASAHIDGAAALDRAVVGE